MFVADILKEKGGKVFSIGPDATALEAARLIAKQGIGSLLVLDGTGDILGILSERDLAHGLALSGAMLPTVKVSEMMTQNVMVCTPGDTLHSVMERMTHGRFRHLPVVEKGRLAGVVSIGDIVKHRLAELAGEAEALKSYISSA